MNLMTIILAAGKGTRMRSEMPKVLHKIAGKPLLRHVYDMCSALPDNRVAVVYGHGAERVLSEMSDIKTVWVEQKQQLGTGHAVQQVAEHIRDDDVVLILYGDVPLLKRSTVNKMIGLVDKYTLALLTVTLADPQGYGRIVRDADGSVVRIVEQKDADDAERQIREVNTGIMAVPGGRLKNWLNRLQNNNAQGEYYLTDIIEMAVVDRVAIQTSHPESADEVLGVNDRCQLSHLERVYQNEQAIALMAAGITLADPARFDLRGQIENLGQDIEIDVNVILEGKLSLGSNVKIGPNCIIKDSNIGDGSEIFANSVIENAIVGQNSRVGPFARLRPGAILADSIHVGNFVEIKNSSVGTGTKINHLSYIGDSMVGSKVNIGAGTITCNYDGVNKSKTMIGDGAFIGSNSQLVAPVKIGANATIGAGSTITRDAPENQLTLSRAKQVSISGWQRPGKKEK